MLFKTTGKVIKRDEVLAFSANNDEKTTRDNQPRVTYTKVTVSALNLIKFTMKFTKGNICKLIQAMSKEWKNIFLDMLNVVENSLTNNEY